MGNIELLKKTREQIIMFPDKHDQGSWHCGTTMCIAGHACVQAGAKLEIHDNGMTELVYEGRAISAPCFADDMLDLSNDEYGYLFFCMDNEVAMKRMDQVIALWEEGKVLEDISWDERIEDPNHCDCGDCE